MTLDAVRAVCTALPGVTEDIKWGSDLAFSVGGKMFCVVNAERPHQMSFKCTADDFAELVEREGLIPAPYLARAMWVQQVELASDALDRRELERLLRMSYEMVVDKLPKSKRPVRAVAPGGRSVRTGDSHRSQKPPTTRRRIKKRN
ncbi:MAG TPA: MmcQ/YjbR family DNA-binding protein [Vicinamibacterales bacterium]